jgi:nicotinamidase-related amidase
MGLMPTREHAALVVVDMQERLMAAMPSVATLTLNAQRLIRGFQVLARPVLVTEQYPKGLGPTVPSIARLVPGPRPAKLSFSCFGCPEFVAAVEPHQDLVLCGIETHVCVLLTALDALDAGRRVFVAADAVCSRTSANRDLALDQMRAAGVVVTSTESLLFALLGAAGTDEFRQISALVK